MLIGAALIEGLIVGIALCGWIAVILKVNPRFEMKSYPDAIVKAVAPQTKEERRGFLFMALPVLILVTAYMIFSVYSDYFNTSTPYLILYLHSFIILMVWNALDLVVFDWLLFCKINPAFMVMPGTKDNPAYKDYKYHFIGFMKGTVLAAVAALVVSGIAYGLRQILK